MKLWIYSNFSITFVFTVYQSSYISFSINDTFKKAILAVFQQA